MENLKIRVNSKAESKEAQGLLEKLGFKKFVWDIYSDYFIFANSNYYSRDNISNFSECDYKEITLPELRDLVVLKRNDVGDATHTDPNEKESLYFRLFGEWWNLFTDGRWQQFCHMESPRAAKLKPIEKKEMKEYLIKSGDGKYLLTHHDSIGAIEIPEGSNIAVIEDSKVRFYSKYTSADLDHLGKDLIWMRPSTPEELPFIDDGITDCREAIQEIYKPSDFGASSLNDQYAEIEKVRQSAWKKQEGGSHYKNLKIQPMQYALENKLDYAQANVVKYVTRHKEKSGKEDLLKAIHNIELMIEFYYGDEK